MIDFLKDYGITDNVIKEIEIVNSSANLYNFSCNRDEIIKIISFLKECGVTCIEELLVHRLNIFFMTFDKVKNMFEEQDLSNFIQLINDDYSVIDEL